MFVELVMMLFAELFRNFVSMLQRLLFFTTIKRTENVTLFVRSARVAGQCPAGWPWGWGIKIILARWKKCA